VAGNIVCYKAPLVAQGFSQVPGVDYFDTFAPVTHLALIRSILALAASEDPEIHQIDIKSTYLNGELTEREHTYMCQPPGYKAPNSNGKVYHLLKTLYGLKQSGHHWYQKWCNIVITHLGYTCCDVDMAVFYKCEANTLAVIMVHVDDCTIATTSLSLITEFKAKVSEHVEIMDLGELHWLLGIEII
jgi:hypothetical protein